MSRRPALALTLSCLAAGGGGLATAQAQHPLDPLSAQEIRAATQAMKADSRLPEGRPALR